MGANSTKNDPAVRSVSSKYPSKNEGVTDNSIKNKNNSKSENITPPAKVVESKNDKKVDEKADKKIDNNGIDFSTKIKFEITKITNNDSNSSGDDDDDDDDDVKLDRLRSACEKYTKDKKYVFKSCNNEGGIVYSKFPKEWLVIMTETKGTINNEHRSGVIDKNFAKFRANMMEVVAIININKPDLTIDSVKNVFEDMDYQEVLEYKVGHIVKCNKYDENIENICSGGVHYYKSLVPAFYYKRYHSKYTGSVMAWHDNGLQRLDERYILGFNDGIKTVWHSNGKLELVCSYINGVKNGKYTTWQWDGEKDTDLFFKDGYVVQNK